MTATPKQTKSKKTQGSKNGNENRATADAAANNVDGTHGSNGANGVHGSNSAKAANGANGSKAANGANGANGTNVNGHYGGSQQASVVTTKSGDGKRKKTTVFIIMDAGRADYVRPDSMPFTHGLSQQATTGQFESPPGFAQRTVLFSGRNPDTSGNFSAFVYDPENSPFKWLRSLGPMANLLKPRKVMVPGRWALAGMTKQITDAYHTDPAWIPPKFLPFFRPCEDMQPIYEPGALDAASIFDLCREHDLKYRYLAHPVSGDDEEVYKLLVRELRDGEDYDLYVAQFSVTDQKGHTKGPFSDAMQKGYLRTLDQKIASIHAALSANYDDWDLFLCGDHGMAPVTKKVNLLEHLKQVDAEPAEDYVVFVNSTIAVFWYLTEKGRREVEKALPSIPHSQPIDDERRKELRIPTERRWGDRMVIADSGVLYWPDYFHVTDSKIVGMHGYIDKTDESYGMGVLLSSDQERKTVDHGHLPLVDVFPTLCDLIGVPTPETNEGKSMIEAPKRRRRRRSIKGYIPTEKATPDAVHRV